MGKITLHAGRPKAGSSAIRAWMRANVEALAQQGVTVVRFGRPGDVAQVVPDNPPSVNSMPFTTALGAQVTSGEDPSGLVRRAMDSLGSIADQHPHILLTSEGWASALDRGGEVLHEGIDRLARHHDVTIALYVRPQHGALIAGWCQWGFRATEPMSRYVEGLGRRLFYDRSRLSVMAGIPHAHLIVRPFVADALHRRDVVEDFASELLGLDARDGDFRAPERVNVSPTLELALLLRDAPDGFWTGRSTDRSPDNPKREIAMQLMSGSPLVEPSSEVGAAAERIRQTVHRWAYDRYEADNAALIDALGWQLPHFIEPPELGGDPAPLESIDEIVRTTFGTAPRSLFTRIERELVPKRTLRETLTRALWRVRHVMRRR
jgi:hypothetical protein